MTTAYRIGLSIIGLMAVVATVALVSITLQERKDAATARPIGAAPGSRGEPAPEAAPETTAEPGLVFNHPGPSQAAFASVAKVGVYD